MRCASLVTALLLAACGAEEPPGPVPARTVATFSIVARDPLTGDLGVAVQSKFLAAGSVVPWARADVGAVATQAFANTTYATDGLDLLDDGVPADEVVRRLTEDDPGQHRRQVGIVDACGRAAAHTGTGTLAWAGHRVGEGYACQGNILAGPQVVEAMARAFESVDGPLPERLVAALAAGQAAGGDRRGRQSAALFVVRRGGGYAGLNDRYIDLRVDDHPRPIGEIARLLELHRALWVGTPVPVQAEGLVREPKYAPSGSPTPRSTWREMIDSHRAADYARVHALHARSFRATVAQAAFVARARAGGWSRARLVGGSDYVGTRAAEEGAAIVLWIPRSQTLTTLRFVEEDGAWRLVE